ncbi:MAG: hypothetical protein V7K23_28050 [Nostoc sp.]
MKKFTCHHGLIHLNEKRCLRQAVTATANWERYPEGSKLQLGSKFPSETVLSKRGYANNFEELF